jgi:hypothetical protein
VASGGQFVSRSASRLDQRAVRQPVVVVVYTGGTIGALVDESNVHLDRDDGAVLLQAFDKRTTLDYAQLAGPDLPMPFDLEWERLPPGQELLSEDASPETWKNLGEAVQRICAKYASPDVAPEAKEAVYLAGIVLLHGTDTLAYSAAALSLSLGNLPCPVVLTGANQPPNVQSILERDLINSESDAWKNILRSLLFIQSFGHRFTEVFVCFHDTVHLALNLRKAAIDRVPHPLQRELKVQEPFFYRNRGPQRQYAYRLIDGLYCNNLYPISPDLGYNMLIRDYQNTYRHIRQSPWAPRLHLERSEFADGVKLVSASPVTLVPKRTHSHGFEIGPDTKIVLIDGYNSGTFPTSQKHSFHDFLRALQREAIPVVLVTKDGLIPSKQRYEMSLIDGVQMPVLRLFALVAETAAPLLSLVLATLEDQWNPAPALSAEVLLQHRHRLLEAAIRKRQDGPDGILSALLGDILNEDEQRKARIERIQRRDADHMQRVTELFAESRQVKLPGRRGGLAPSGRRGKASTFDASMTVFMRQHFLWLLGEVVHSFENASAGPDGLAFWNELGFAWGAQVRETLSPPDFRGQRALFTSRSTEERQELITAAQRQVDIITRFLLNYGVADVKAEMKLVEPIESKRHRGGRFSLKVEAQKHGRGGRSDDLFAVLGYQNEEVEFFRALREGCGLGTIDDEECRSTVENQFAQRFEHALSLKVSPLDWFLIGVYKALTTGVLRDLSFDPWVYRCDSDDPPEIDALRQSIRTEIVAADRNVFSMMLSYASREAYHLDGR